MKNFDNTVKRKNRILDQMLDDGVITKVDYDEAYQEEIKLNIQEVQKRDYIQTFVSYCAIRELMKRMDLSLKIHLRIRKKERPMRRSMMMRTRRLSRCF